MNAHLATIRDSQNGRRLEIRLTLSTGCASLVSYDADGRIVGDAVIESNTTFVANVAALAAANWLAGTLP